MTIPVKDSLAIVPKPSLAIVPNPHPSIISEGIYEHAVNNSPAREPTVSSSQNSKAEASSLLTGKAIFGPGPVLLERIENSLAKPLPEGDRRFLRRAKHLLAASGPQVINLANLAKQLSRIEAETEGLAGRPGYLRR